MDTRRRAPEPAPYEPSIRPGGAAGGPLAPEASPAPGFQEGDQRLGRIADALHANLSRGFLESEERFRQIAEALHDIVFLSDAEFTRHYFVNAAYEHIWGRPREELYENALAFLDGVHPDDRERVRDVVTKLRRGEYDIEFRVVRPDGALRWVWSRGFPVRDSSGEIYRIAGITEDITERKQVIASHERLIRGFTHDVKNPLGAADGYLSLLETGVFGEMPASQMESIAHARRSIRTALDLIAQLLDIERAQTGELSLNRHRFDLGAVASDLVAEFRAAANAKHLDLTLEAAPVGANEPLRVHSDRARVRQIIANLISNAVKYTQPDGSVTVRVLSVDETAAPGRGRWAAVVVADNGPGIPLDKQHLLFREFTRFSPDAAEGSGIGLAISQRLARALDANITFESAPGLGSTFTLWIPIDRRQNFPE